MVGERLRRFESARPSRRGSAEVEEVHHLRVSARRLQAALSMFQPLVSWPGVRRRPIRRVERRFGALRDLDVLAGLLRDLPGDQAVPELARAIATERERARDGGDAALERGGLARTLAALDRWLEHPEFTPLASLPLDLLRPDLAGPTLSRVFLHPGWLVEGTPGPDDPYAADLHALRRQLKAFRYRLECIAAGGGEELEGWLDELHAMQDALGGWHDQGVLAARLRELGASPVLLEHIRGRARAALASWPGWRARYRSPEFRHQARGRLEPAIHATG